MRIHLPFILAALLATSALAQTPAKKSVPTQIKPQSPAYSPTPEQLAMLPALRVDLEDIRKRIAQAEVEDQKYSGGLIKALIQSRIAVMRITDALVEQRIKSIETGARMIIETPSTKPDPAVVVSLDGEASAQRLKIEQARVDSDRYSGGLIKAQKESTIATMENTLAMLEQKALISKYGLGLPTAAATSPSTVVATQFNVKAVPSQKVTRNVLPQDEILKVRLLSKRFTEQKYQKYIFFDIEFSAEKLSKPARAIKGTLTLNDLFGERIMGIGWTIDRPTNPGESLTESGQGFQYNQFMEKHKWVNTTDLSNMTATFTVESILYQDEPARTSIPISTCRKTPNPSINTDWRDKAAPAGYVKRYANQVVRPEQ